MGTLLYSTILQTEYKDCQDKTKQDAKRIRTHQAPQPQHRAGRSGWSQEGREVVKRLWAHIKTNKLQDPENKQYFVPDTKMQPIFGKEKIRAFGMAKFLKTHLTA